MGVVKETCSARKAQYCTDGYPMDDTSMQPTAQISSVVQVFAFVVADGTTTTTAGAQKRRMCGVWAMEHAGLVGTTLLLYLVSGGDNSAGSTISNRHFYAFQDLPILSAIVFLTAIHSNQFLS